jgi:UDP-N-acetylglucosamine--N-acetylmuramyl-(pentapeptide) pyrophosphoryl-undecaprenol N-acetylglucosamine transferase
MSRPVVLIAGGGTGGHVFPGLAVADALRSLADVDVVFCGSPRGMEKELVPARGYPLELLDVAPMKGGGAKRMVSGAIVAARATVQAAALVRRLRPSVVLSVGGYAAGPVALACVLARVPLGVLEPNAVMGLANRILAPLAGRVYVTWEESARGARKGAIRVTGVPIRPGFESAPYQAKKGRLRVLVLGGSLGAEAINERLPPALGALGVDFPELEVLHQTGRGKDGAVRDAYVRHDLTTRARVVPFLDDVAGELAKADLVVARAGAGTVAEIAAVGRASLLVPFPFAADDHQAKNAAALARTGGAVCLLQSDATPERLAAELRTLATDAQLRAKMALAATAVGRPHAAYEVAGDLLHLACISLRPPRRKANGAGAAAPAHGGV